MGRVAPGVRRDAGMRLRLRPRLRRRVGGNGMSADTGVSCGWSAVSVMSSTSRSRRFPGRSRPRFQCVR